MKGCALEMLSMSALSTKWTRTSKSQIGSVPSKVWLLGVRLKFFKLTLTSSAALDYRILVGIMRRFARYEINLSKR